MQNILVLNSSITPDSVSKPIVQAVVDRIGRNAHIVSRDLATAPIPHLIAASLAGIRGEPKTALEVSTREASDDLIAELAAADVIVIGAPMYNFGLSTALRSWFDHVIRAGKTFTYGEGGVVGLMTGKRAIVVSSRGGLYADGNGPWADYQEPYLLQLLAFMGITDVQIIRAEGVAYGEEPRAAAIEKALAEVAALAVSELAPAA